MIYFNIVFAFAFLLAFILTRRYEADSIADLNEKEHPLKLLYPLVFFLLDKAKVSRFIGGSKGTKDLDTPLRALYIGQPIETVKRLYNGKKIALVILILFATNILSLFIHLQNSQVNELLQGKYLQRPGITEDSKSVELQVTVESEEGQALQEEINLTIDERQAVSSEVERFFVQAISYVDSVILKENASPEEVRTDFYFPASIPGTGVHVEWATENLDLVDRKGGVHNEDLTGESVIGVTAVFSYQGRQKEYTRFFNILPKEYSVEELTRQSLLEAIRQNNEKSLTEEVMELPQEIGDKKVIWQEVKKNSGSMLLMFGGLTALALYFAMDKDLNDKVIKRNQEMLLDYPEIINKFTLLVGAGMSLSNAWGKISKDYKDKGGEKRFAYEEMTITYSELMIGTSEETAYERFGRRVKLLPYLRFSALLAQNVKKGSVGLLKQLELEAAEAFEERKELAKRMGEEAGTKLLLPMMLMLLLVLVIIMVPAFMSFQF
ncbi:hypothetical protein acsn021_00450 [Anaerocolumna cellulosilytica]|uniref:Uncharacterized protein n=1 Tax=Anaerocolumna cellulosilytica TaxID=433286 RepID=A0A6S6QS76_9FIRM|nr:type II secretion system F family protein [Anaerocolumna cellulosilytica]MBB5196204.1 pilus assembly protein TadC [Anaerocolumna cellulosilytica]BCJ92476.1 hypothetical protein acsn021_00450 [Anaerocolumna cellulosilytica]